jgi:hypothetical protein
VGNLKVIFTKKIKKQEEMKMTKKLMRKMTMVAFVLLLLAVVRPMEVEAMPRPSGLYAWTNCDMCIRSNNGLGGSIVAVAPKGAEVVVFSADDNAVDGFHWARVRYSDAEGYMAYANESQNLEFLEFQKWNDIEGTSGWVQILQDVELHKSPNPEISGTIVSLKPGDTVLIEAEMKPTKYGSNVCRVLWNEAVEGYIPANNDVADFYEYLGNPDSSESASIAPTTEDSNTIEKLGIVNRPMCLRTMPNKNSQVLRVADTFEEVWVEALETNASGEQWYRVITGTDEAYIATFGVNVGCTLDRDAETNRALNLRSGPSTDAQRWVTLPEGLPVWAMSEFSGVGTSENWIRVAVDYEGRKYYGFVIKQGLSIL